MIILSCDDKEKTIHLSSIEKLAKEFRRSIEEVFRLYASELENFQKNARVRIFLHILTSKNVKKILSQ
jgi:hypothetical protein